MPSSHSVHYPGAGFMKFIILLGILSTLRLAAQTPAIVLPNGGEKLQAGSSYTIRWLGIKTGDTSALEYSTNNGASWLPIADKLTGVSYQWNPVPATPSNQCKVKLTVKRPAAVSDTILFCNPTAANTSSSSRHAEFDPSGAWVVTADDSGYVRLYNSTTTALRWEKRLCTPQSAFQLLPVMKARFSPDGAVVAAYTARDSIILLDATNGNEIRRWHNGITSFPAPITDRSCAFSPDGTILAVSTYQHVRFYNPADGSLIRDMSQFTDGGVNVVEWTNDSKSFLAGMASGRIYVVDATSGTTVQTLAAQFSAESACFSPDGSSIVCTARSLDNIQMWDVASGTLRFQVPAQRGVNISVFVSFANDGLSFYTSNESLASPSVYMIRQRSATDGSLLSNVRYARVNLGSFNYNATATRFCCTSGFGAVILQPPTGGVQVLTDESDGNFSIESNAPQLDSALIYIPKLRATAGESIDVPIKIRGALAVKASSLQVNLRFLADILEPQAAPAGTTIVGKQRVLPLTLPAQATADSVLLRIPCRAMLGIDSTSVLDLDTVIVNGTAKVSVEDGSLTLDICRQGSPRLFDDSHTLALQLTSAHPICSGVLNANVALIEKGITSVELVDAYGRLLPLIAPMWMDAGIHHLSMPVHDIATGSYVLRLTTPSQTLVLPIVVLR